MGTRIEGVYSNKDVFRNYQSTVLASPGFYPTPHSKSMFIDNFHANKFVAGGLKGIFNLSSQFHLRLEAYTFMPVRKIESDNLFNAKYGEDIFTRNYIIAAGALVYHTGIGPVSLAFNYYEKPDTNLFVTLNFGYVLFNKRGF